MDRISLSAGFVDILKVYSPKSKIIEQLHQDMDINKFKEFLGLVKKNATEEDGVAKNNQLEAADLSVIIEALIKEMSIGNNSEIKCIIHNFIKATTQRDPKFQQRTAGSYRGAFEASIGILRHIVIDKDVQIFDDPLPVEEPFKALTWIHELLDVYRHSLEADLLRSSFQLAARVISKFAAYIHHHKFVTMKQSEVFVDALKVTNILLEKALSSIVLEKENEQQLCSQMVADLESLSEYSEKLGRDLLFHISFLIYKCQSEKDQANFRYKYFDYSHGLLKEEPACVSIVSRIGAFMNIENTLDLEDKLIRLPKRQFTILEFLHDNCAKNQLNLKQSAFKVLRDAFNKIASTESMAKQYHANASMSKQIFNLIMLNWEFPLKGFANSMEDVFANYLQLFPSEKDKLQLAKNILDNFPSKTRRKYATLRLITKGVDVDEYIKAFPDIIPEILTYENLAASPFVVQLFKELLNQAYIKISKKHKDNKKVVEEWTEFWINPYIDVVANGEFDTIKDINEHVNPQIFSICEKSLPLLISRLFLIKSKSINTSLSVQASLVRYARSRDILVCENNKFKLIGVDEQSISIDWKDFLEKIISHNNRSISLDGLRIVIEPKKDSLPMNPIEYELLERAIVFNTKNSYPDFRNNMTSAVKKFLHRLRNNLNPPLKKLTDKKSFDGLLATEKEFSLFVGFLSRLKTILLEENYPDAPYESVYPLLECVKVVYESFNDQPFYFRKKTRFEGTNLLRFVGLYEQSLFEMFLSGFKCQWDTIRKISFEILRFFPQQLDFFTEDYKTHKILNPSKNVLLQSPIVKDIEAATFSLSLLFERCSGADEKLSFIEKLIEEFATRQQLMKEFFFEGSKEFSENLYHGLLTTFSIIAGEWSNFVQIVKADKGRARKIYSRLMEEVSKTISFAKTVISKSHVTYILDNKETEDAIKRKQGKYKKLMEKIESANTLLDAFNDEEDEGAVQSDNMTVVAFYLISKESGSLFAKILEVAVQAESTAETKDVFEPSEVIAMVKTFTDALLNIKHLGAIDRISMGLSFFCKKFYEMSNVNYSGLASEILTFIMTTLHQGDCQTIFRRSAGLPNAVCALLKAEPVGMKITVFPKVLAQLQELAEKDADGHPEVRIHAINILRIAFQDAELKQDMEHHVGQGLALAIRGFSNNDWSIRNSSLMLYSAIMKRLFPNVSNEIQANYRSGLNVIQFFVFRAPSLLKFFFDEIVDFSKRANEHNMYPTIYPISLILSKLLPYDMKTSEAEEEEGSDKKEESESGYQMNDIAEGDKKRFVTANEINQFRGLLLSCAGSKNFLGRVLVARAIVPFVTFNDVASFLDTCLPKTLKEIKADHNQAHGRLLIAKFVISNFKQVCLPSSFIFDNGKSSSEIYKEICIAFSNRQQVYLKIQCAPVLLTYFEILHELSNDLAEEPVFVAENVSHFQKSVDFAHNTIIRKLSKNTLRNEFDFCNGELQKSMIEFYLKSRASNEAELEVYIRLVLHKLLHADAALNVDDTDLLQYSLKYFIESVKGSSLGKIVTKACSDGAPHILDILLSILSTNKKMINLVKYLVELLARMVEFGFNFDSDQIKVFVEVMRIGYTQNKENGDLMKDLIKVAPFFTADEPAQLRILADILKYYSEPEQKDDNRMNCVLGLATLKPRFKSILKLDFDIYLTFMSTLVKLLLDELAPIRKKVCKIIYPESVTLQNDNVALIEVFHLIFDEIAAEIKDKDSAVLSAMSKQFQFFMMELVCDPTIEKYKHMANYQSRIFNFDKPNKYREEVKVMKAILANREALPFKAQMSQAVFEEYKTTRNVPQPVDFEREAKESEEDPYKRSEYIHGVVYLREWEKKVLAGSS